MFGREHQTGLQGVSSTSKRKLRREEAVVEGVKRWLGNPISKLTLRLICSRDKHGENRLDIALRRYTGEDVPCNIWDRFTSFLVSLTLEKGSSIFGYSTGDLKKSLRDEIVRRGIINVLEGIARYGVRRPFVSAAPFLVVWNYTTLCNLRCRHCYLRAGSKPAEDELTTEEAKKVVDDLASAGVVAIAFSGGEPLLRKDIFEVAGYAKSKGFYVSLATNGATIIPEVARKVKEVFDYVEISLDGFEETHDQFRGVRGAWRRTCEGIRNCVAEGIDTCVAVTATRYNFEEIPKLIEFAEKELGVHRVIVFNYVPVGRGKDMVEADISPQERQKLLKYLYMRMMGSRMMCYSTAPQYSVVSLELAGSPVVTHFASSGTMRLQGRTKALADFIGGCGAGRLYCGLEPNGDIVPCVFMPIVIGNVRRDRLQDVWHSSELLWELRNRDEIKGCGDCEYRYICGGCRARAYGYFGNVLAPDPACIHNLEYWHQLRHPTPTAKAPSYSGDAGRAAT
uniref:Radical SAM protein n=1 Tax=Candidatus Caldatribacterium californiense TaxID=1454726 RepID=A0A7V3YN50_9BACT